MPSKPSKKIFTDSDGAVERFFINSPKEQAQIEGAAETTVRIEAETEEGLAQVSSTQKTPVMPPTQDSYEDDAQQTQVQAQMQMQTQNLSTISPSAVAEKGLRKERIGLLLDAQLKEDLAHLSKATGSKSLNDFLVTMLTAYAESPESREKLIQYRRLLQA